MIRECDFGCLADGSRVKGFVMENSRGMEVQLLCRGAVIYRIRIPDRDGNLRDTVLYYEDIRDYEANHGCVGACAGPVANRVGGAAFDLDGVHYELEANNGVNNLHSGSGNVAKKFWEGKAEGETVVMRIRVPDGEAGFPGNRELTVTYRLTEDNTLEIGYAGTTDKTTLMNPTNHSYFNLWDNREHVLDTRLWMDADYTTEVDSELIPTGKMLPVEGTVFDFRKEKPIGQDEFREDEQLSYGQGYDHNFVLNGSGYRKVAEAWHPKSGLAMEVFTDQPAVQLYTANTMGAPFGRNRGFCLETQHHPDGIHHPEFPSVVLKPGETFRSKTGYRFYVK